MKQDMLNHTFIRLQHSPVYHKAPRNALAVQVVEEVDELQGEPEPPPEGEFSPKSLLPELHPHGRVVDVRPALSSLCNARWSRHTRQPPRSPQGRSNKTRPNHREDRQTGGIPTHKRNKYIKHMPRAMFTGGGKPRPVFNIMCIRRHYNTAV